eukprot:9045741-Alexandrium_andersonii.AAC.1
MSASLVGSEMCIRDRAWTLPKGRIGVAPRADLAQGRNRRCATGQPCPRAVSYTHLTLPTICSV